MKTMMKITSYIINLETSTKRKEYMEELLQPYSFIEPKFISAIDGRILSDEQLAEKFDYTSSLKYYGREINKGEVGCTLSHRKCYQTLLDSREEYVLIFEDDIYPVRDLHSLQEINISTLLSCEQPRILLLSGDFWYWRKTNGIATVYDAVGSYAYFINRAAAKRILSVERTMNTADDWFFYKRLGVEFFAVSPYVVDANVNMNLLGSEIQQEYWGIQRKKMSLYWIGQSYLNAVMKRILMKIGHFESKIRDFNFVENTSR